MRRILAYAVKIARRKKVFRFVVAAKNEGVAQVSRNPPSTVITLPVM